MRAGTETIFKEVKIRKCKKYTYLCCFRVVDVIAKKYGIKADTEDHWEYV